MVVFPPFHTPKWSYLVGKPKVVGYHHFRKPPYVQTLHVRQRPKKILSIFCGFPQTQVIWSKMYDLMSKRYSHIIYGNLGNLFEIHFIKTDSSPPENMTFAPKRKCHFPTKSIFRCYLSDHTTQLYGDDFISHEIRIPMNHWPEPQTTNF